jgi:hypothetical protein
MNALLIIWIAAFLIVSSWDWDEETSQEEEYAQMVCSRVWPDYRGTNPQCK